MYVNLIGYELTFNVGFFSTKMSFQIFFIYFYSKYDPNQYNLLENVRIVAGSEGGGSRGRARAPPRHVSGEASAAAPCPTPLERRAITNVWFHFLTRFVAYMSSCYL